MCQQFNNVDKNLTQDRISTSLVDVAAIQDTIEDAVKEKSTSGSLANVIQLQLVADQKKTTAVAPNIEKMV